MPEVNKTIINFFCSSELKTELQKLANMEGFSLSLYLRRELETLVKQKKRDRL